MPDEVSELEWDERNLYHILDASPHGLTPAIAEEVGNGQPKLFENAPLIGRSGSHLMIGTAADGRFWTVVLLRLGGSRWRPITGWPSTGGEQRRYQLGESAGHGRKQAPR